MTISIGTLAALASLGVSLKNSQDRDDAVDRVQGMDSSEPVDVQAGRDQMQAQEEIKDRINDLVEIESIRGPTPGDKDAFSSVEQSVPAGGTVQITVQPNEGERLYVKEVVFSLIEDFDYEITVAGDVSSVAHQAKYSRPRVVQGADRLVAIATNNGSSAKTITLEVEAWSETTGNGGMR